MKNQNLIMKYKATLKIEVEGYFVERFINLCKINNIKIWNIENLTPGKITAYIYSHNLKDLAPFIIRAKCNMNILEKKGVYFWFLKYKKRKVAILIFAILIFVLYSFSNFIWKINIKGNNNISNNQIINILEEIGIKKGILKNCISTGYISDYIRSKLYEIAWAGITIDGTTLNIEVVEKTLEDNTEFNKLPGNIISKSNAIITKIVADNGTALFNVGSYIAEGEIAIEGKNMINGEEKNVHASGILMGKTEYIFEKEYCYLDEIKENYGKTLYGISLGVNDKKIDIKYLPKDIKYDINISEKNITIFGLDFFISLNRYDGYILNTNIRTKDELIEIAKLESDNYLYELKCSQKNFITKNVNIEEYDNRIVYKVKYIMEENIAKFKEMEE